MPSIRRRKYWTTQQRHKEFTSLTAYQTLSPETCRDKLLHALADTAACYRFLDRADILPMIHNMVSTVHLHTDLPRIDLALIGRCLPNTVYDRRKFAAITIRIDNPRTTALLFSSGKLVVTGSISRQMSICAVRGIVKMLQGLHIFRFVRYDLHAIQNIVCNVRLPRDMCIDIQRLYAEQSSLCTYQPSIFPGLIMRPQRSPVVLLVFKSSRIVVTGARNYADIINGFQDSFATIRAHMQRAEPEPEPEPEPAPVDD